MENVVWIEFVHQGYTCVKGENDCLSVTVVPQRGSKIVSLFDKINGREWIYRTERPWEPLNPGMDWNEGDRGGWDEMFPTITPSPCPDEAWEHVFFPDHGEVWSRPWRYDLDGDKLRMEIDGVQFPYTLSKIISLEGNRLNINYELENRTSEAFSYLWAAHPLLQVQPGMKLITMPAQASIQLTYSHRERLGGLFDITSYPLAATKEGGITDLSTLEDASGGHAEKYYFTNPLEVGYAGICDPTSGAGIFFSFVPEEIPYLGIWAHYGAFGNYTFAIEPATGYLDSVQEAYNRGKVKRVAGKSTDRWRLEVQLRKN
ncbi:DUF4432 family protein [Paenibacillus sp. BAC0078]